MKTRINNATLITPHAILAGHYMLLEGDRILELGRMEGDLPECDAIVDARGALVMPGLIDIHSDMIEQLLQPRSTALMDFEVGLREAEKQLAACGITTMYHSISMYRDGSWDVKEIRKSNQVKRLARLIQQLKEKDHLINHKYHLRYEIDNLPCYEEALSLIDKGLVGLVSIMDHTPCQGQYQDLSIYRKHLPGSGREYSDQEFDLLVERELNKEKVSNQQLKALGRHAAAKGIAVASHDDDKVEKLEENLLLGVSISEFPITMEVARKAVEMGYRTVLGAPNVLLGGSHSGNLSAQEAVREGNASILCSDYYPQALLRSLFLLSANLGLPLFETCRLATLHPAEAVGIDGDYGSLEAGKKADFLILREGEHGFPVLEQTWVDGVCVLRLEKVKGRGISHGDHLGNNGLDEEFLSA